MGQFNRANQPGSRSNPSMVSHDGTLYLFGGHTGEMWAYRQTDWTVFGEWAWIGGTTGSEVAQYATPTPFPGSRSACVMWIFPPKLYIFGGFVVSTYYADLWSFDLNNNKWELIKGTTTHASFADNIPGPVRNPMLLHTTNDGKAFIFGGYGYDASDLGFLCDVWRFDTNSNSWQSMRGSSAVNSPSIGGPAGSYDTNYHPSGRYASAVAGNGGKSYIYGGTSNGGTAADLWCFDIDSNQWAYIAGDSSGVNGDAIPTYGAEGVFSSQHPGSLSHAVSWTDPHSNLMLIYGGYGYKTSTTSLAFADMWAYNVTMNEWAWISGDSDMVVTISDTWFNTVNHPGSRSSASSSADDSTGLMFLFGGQNPLADLWTTRGPVPSPLPPKLTPILTMTPAQWRWMLGPTSDWSSGIYGPSYQFSEAYYPGARSYATMTRASSGVSFLYGGIGYAGTSTKGKLGDVWAFRLSSWTSRGQWAWIAGKSNSVDYTGEYSGASPYIGARYSSVAWFVPPTSLMIHGGSGHADVWSFDVDTEKWQWVTGSSETKVYPFSVGLNTPNPSNTPGSVSAHNLLTVNKGGDALMWSGHAYNSRLGVYQFDYSLSEWIFRRNAGSDTPVAGPPGVLASQYHPGERKNCAIMDVPESSSVYIFGGTGYTSGGQCHWMNDLWMFDVALYQWAYIGGNTVNPRPTPHPYGSFGVFDVGNWPTPRDGPFGWADPSGELLHVFGGSTTTDFATNIWLSDFWTYNISRNQWAWVEGDSTTDQTTALHNQAWFNQYNKPGGRAYGGETIYNDLGMMCMYGGSVTSQSYVVSYWSDMWCTMGPMMSIGASPTLTPTPSSTPTPTSTPSPPPTPSPHPLLPLQYRLMSGSVAPSSTGYRGSIQEYSPENCMNSCVGSAMVSNGGSTYVFGGSCRLTGKMGDIWGYKQQRWSDIGQWAWLGGSSVPNDAGKYAPPDLRPCGRTTAVMWFNSPSHVHVFGGTSSDTLADHWIFDTTSLSWTLQSGSSTINTKASFTSNVPGSVKEHMVLSSNADSAHVFGGYGYDTNYKSYLSDVWKWQSGAWTWVNGASKTNLKSVGGVAWQFDDTYHPGGRTSSAVMSSRYAFLYGGFGFTAGAGADMLGDMWAYDTTAEKWAYVTGALSDSGYDVLPNFGTRGYFGTGTHPGALRQLVGWSDPISDLIYVFGGYGYVYAHSTGYFNDFWSFNASMGYWSWAGGDSTASVPGHGDVDWFSHYNKPASRSECASSVDVSLGMMYLFGGRQNGYFNDLWATRGPTIAIGGMPTPTPTPLHSAMWRWISGTSSVNQQSVAGSIGQYGYNYVPGARSKAAIAHDGADLYIFGGTGYCYTCQSTGGLNDVWTYRSHQWAWIGGNIAAINVRSQYLGPTPHPGCRSSHVMWINAENHLYSFGGHGLAASALDGSLADVWSFDVVNRQWQWQHGPTIINNAAVFGQKDVASAQNLPGAVEDQALLFSDGEMICFGGYGMISASTQSHWLSDTWKYAADQWTWINGESTSDRASVGGESGVYNSQYHPGGRQGCSVMRRDRKAYLYGGSGYTTTTSVSYLLDMWAYDITINAWAYVSGQSEYTSGTVYGSYGVMGIFGSNNLPGSRQHAHGFADPNSDLLYLFGGYGYAESSTLGLLGDYWAYNVTLVQWAWCGGGSVINQRALIGDPSWYGLANVPGARNEHTGVSSGDVMFVFGGSGYGSGTSSGRLNDLWSTMGCVAVVGPSPTPTASPTVTASPSPSPSHTPTATASPTPGPCSPGHYKQGHMCLKCPDGEVSGSEDAPQCSRCVAGTRTNEKQTQCVPCHKGSYSLDGQSECTPCPAGFACPFTVNDTVIPCAAGYYALNMSFSCTRCEVGYECPHTNGDGRKPCIAGHSYSSGGLQHCITYDCPPSFYCPSTANDTHVQCDAGTWSSGNRSVCVACKAGNACPSLDGTGIHTCMPGTFSKGKQVKCTACPPGYECPKNDGSQNAKCGIGTFSLSGRCSSCPTGTYCPMAGMSVPTACPAGQYNNGVGLTLCHPCKFASRCLAGNNCTSAYAGNQCMTCAADHFLLGVECRSCAVIPLAMIPFVVVGVILFILLLRRGLNIKQLSELKIFFTQMQFFLITLKFDIVWPPAIRKLIEVLEGFNISFDIVNPQCFVRSWNWVYKFDLAIGVAFGTLALLELWVALLWCYRQISIKLAAKYQTKVNEARDLKVSGWILGTQRIVFLVISVMYVPLTTLFVETMMCTTVDGNSVLFYDMSVECSARRTAAIVMLACFSVMIPVVIAAIIRYLSRKEEKRMRRRDYEEMDGSDNITNRLHVLDQGLTQIVFGVLYESYDYKRPGLAKYFEATNMIRKVLVVTMAVVLGAVSNGIVQAIVMSIITSLFFIMVLKERPFGVYLSTRRFRIRGKVIRIDILNTLEIGGCLINALASVFAIIGAVFTMSRFAGTMMAVLSVIHMVLVTTLTVMRKRRRDTEDIKRDTKQQTWSEAYEMRFVELKGMIKSAYEEESYREAEQYQADLNRLRGHRVAELNHLILIKSVNLDVDGMARYSAERELYAPPPGADLMLVKTRRASSFWRHEGMALEPTTSEISPALEIDLNVMEQRQKELRNYINDGTVCEDLKKWESLQKLLSDIDDAYAKCINALAVFIKSERFRYAYDVAKRISTIKHMVSPRLVLPLSARLRQLLSSEWTLGTVMTTATKVTGAGVSVPLLDNKRSQAKMWSRLCGQLEKDMSLTDAELILRLFDDYIEQQSEEIASIQGDIDRDLAIVESNAIGGYSNAALHMAHMKRIVRDTKIVCASLAVRLAVVPVAIRMGMGDGEVVHGDVCDDMWPKLRGRVLSFVMEERYKAYGNMEPLETRQKRPIVDDGVNFSDVGDYSLPDMKHLNSTIADLRLYLMQRHEGREDAVMKKKEEVACEIDRYLDAISNLIPWHCASQEYDACVLLTKYASECRDLLQKWGFAE